MDKLKFQQAIDKIVDVQHERNGIGTLGEKTLHAVLKHYYEPYEDNHETKIGNYVADIVGENGIIEIQTRNFDKLLKKLTAFLEVANVTVVYPIAQTKWLYWVDTNTGEVTKKRKSPKCGKPYELFYELYWIKDILGHENLRFIVVLLELEEYRSLNGWSKDKKKGSTRVDRIPIDVLEEIELRSNEDFHALLPTTLPKEFTAKELQKATGGSPRKMHNTIQVLKQIGIVKQVGKQGRSFLYTVI